MTTDLGMLEVVAAMLAGLLAGWGYFAILRHTVRIFATRGEWRRPVFLTLARIGCISGLFALAAAAGMKDLLTTLLGFLIARALCIRRLARST
jgi:F1F0 ATPase subunit 2